MDYIKLVGGILLLIAFTWILMRNSKRSGILHALLRIDTVLGMAGGVYLVFNAFHALWIH